MAKKEKSVDKTKKKTTSRKTNVKRITDAASEYDSRKSFRENENAVKNTARAAAESAARASKKDKKVFTAVAVILILAIVGVAVFGYFQGWYDGIFKPAGPSGPSGETQFDENGAVIVPSDVTVSGELEIHFLELGNKYTGDCIYIKAGETDMLIDAGSRQSSAYTIAEYVNNYCTDGKLEYVVATHADQDHIAGLVGTADNGGIFGMYECETIIDFVYSNKNETTASGGRTLYGKYLDARQSEVDSGAKHYTAKQCWYETDGAKKKYALSDNIELEILYNTFYDNRASDENDYSVCLMINQYGQTDGDVKHFLFTGDLEEKGEESLVRYNDLPKVELFKAGHHGSKTSSNESLLKVIQPKAVCVCCCAGSDEYTKEEVNKFPTQLMIDRVAVYTDLVFVTTIYTEDEKGFTSMNGNIRVRSDSSGMKINCSANNILLKDTDWFKEKRTCPEAWAA